MVTEFTCEDFSSESDTCFPRLENAHFNIEVKPAYLPDMREIIQNISDSLWQPSNLEPYSGVCVQGVSAQISTDQGGNHISQFSDCEVHCFDTWVLDPDDSYSLRIYLFKEAGIYDQDLIMLFHQDSHIDSKAFELSDWEIACSEFRKIIDQAYEEGIKKYT